MSLFPEGPAFDTGTLQNTEPGFPGLRGERGPKGHPGLKGIKGHFVPLGFFVPQTFEEGFPSTEQTSSLENLNRSYLGFK